MQINTKEQAIAYAETIVSKPSHCDPNDTQVFLAKKGKFKNCWHVVYWYFRNAYHDGEKEYTVIFNKDGEHLKTINH